MVQSWLHLTNTTDTKDLKEWGLSETPIDIAPVRRIQQTCLSTSNLFTMLLEEHKHVFVCEAQMNNYPFFLSPFDHSHN